MNSNDGNQHRASTCIAEVEGPGGSEPPAEKRKRAGKAKTDCIGGLDKGERDGKLLASWEKCFCMNRIADFCINFE